MEKLSLNILLVDDDPSFVDIVAHQLRDYFHHQVTVARNGAEAMAIIEKQYGTLDMILLDYNIPDVNGLDLLRWLKEHEYATPVIMQTAAGSEAVAVEAMKLGAYDYVRKEHIDLHHLGLLIGATHERHLFRIGKTVDEELAREINLNRVATEQVRSLLNEITPVLHAALANINASIEVKSEKEFQHLPDLEKAKVKKLLREIQKETRTLETGIRGLLGLYKTLYVHHAETQEVDRLKKEFEDKEILRKNSS